MARRPRSVKWCVWETVEPKEEIVQYEVVALRILGVVCIPFPEPHDPCAGDAHLRHGNRSFSSVPLKRMNVQ